MTDSWKTTYDRMVIVKAKASSNSRRYSKLRKKYSEMDMKAHRIVTDFLIDNLSSDHITFVKSGAVTFRLSPAKVWRASCSDINTVFCNYSHVFVKDLDEIKVRLDAHLVSEIGCYAMNCAGREKGPSADEMMLLASEAKEIISRLTPEFMNEFRKISNEATTLRENVKAFEDACYKRDNAADDLKWKTVNDWADEYFAKPGTTVYVTSKCGYRIIDCIKGEFACFTDGSRAKIDNVDKLKSFKANINFEI